jgi:hypothetical protein
MDELAAAHLLMVAAICYLLVSAVAGSYVSFEKGRSGWEGFLFAFVFGPIGLVVAACMPTIPPELKAEDLPRGPSLLHPSPEDLEGEAREALARLAPMATPQP